MLPSRCNVFVLLAIVSGLTVMPLAAQDLRPIDVVPATAVLYLEISDPVAVLASVIDHAVVKQISGLDVFRRATEAPEFYRAIAARKFFELQMGMEWRAAVEAIGQKGIYFAVDGKTRGNILLVRGRDEQIMQDVRLKLLELTRLGGDQIRKLETYRDIPVYRLEKFGFAVVRDWLVVSNNSEAGKLVLDRLLDLSAADGESLSGLESFREAGVARSAEPGVWSWVHLKNLRELGLAEGLFAERTENPLAELLFGGIQSVLRKAQWVSTELQMTAQGLNLKTRMPFEADWIPESRQWYFGQDAQGRIPAVPEVPETLMTLQAYRGVSEMWLRAGDLFDEQTNDRMAEAESSLGTIFGGRDFGEEVLGAFSPAMQLLVARQDFSEVRPSPAIRLPGFALILTMDDPETMRPELRRTFQSAIGFFNIVGAQQGQPQLEMDIQKSDAMDVITSHYVVQKKDQANLAAPLIYNFSPTAVFFGDQFVLSSSESLARTIAEARRLPQENAHTAVAVEGTPLRAVLNDNREQLISQNMLQKGQTHDEAEAELQVILQLMEYLQNAKLRLVPSESQLTLEAAVQLQTTVATEDGSAARGNSDGK